MFAYCNNNPVNYVDTAGLNAESAALWSSTMWWLCAMDGVLPILDLIFVAGIVLLAADYIALAKNNATARAASPSLMDIASTAATPPPPDQGGKGTKVTSKTLYTKSGRDGFHIDVENPGGRPGQIHLQKGGSKYYYNIKDQTFRIGSSNGPLAPNDIQKLLELPKVIRAIEQGLRILGY